MVFICDSYSNFIQIHGTWYSRDIYVCSSMYVNVYTCEGGGNLYENDIKNFS